MTSRPSTKFDIKCGDDEGSAEFAADLMKSFLTWCQDQELDTDYWSDPVPHYLPEGTATRGFHIVVNPRNPERDK